MWMLAYLIVSQRSLKFFSFFKNLLFFLLFWLDSFHCFPDPLCILHCHLFVAVQSLSPTLCNPMDYSTPVSTSFTISWSLLKLRSIESVMPSNHPVLYRPLLLLPSVFPSIRVFHLVYCLSGSLSPSLWLIPPIVFFLYDWSFFPFTSSLLKFSPCSSILFLNWVSHLIADALNSVSVKLCICFIRFSLLFQLKQILVFSFCSSFSVYMNWSEIVASSSLEGMCP